MIHKTAIVNSKAKILEYWNRLGLNRKDYLLATIHRPSNVDSKNDLSNVIKTLNTISKQLPIVFPIHPRTQKMITQFGLSDVVEAMPNLILTEPLGYFDFGKLVAKSKFVITDSGGIQEETTVYRIPCITIRENTERPITITDGTNNLAGNNRELITGFVDQILNDEWKKGIIPKYWDGKTAERIIAFLETIEI